MYAVLYNGLTAPVTGDNVTEETTILSLPNIFETYHSKWYNFLLKAINYNWIFKMYIEELSKITNKIFAYGRYHIVKTIDKTQISEDLFEVEIETETLP
jgi:hypothetical protein